MSRTGADLAMLLLGGFEALVDGTRAELEHRGHPDHRPVHHFALRAIAAGADTVSDLGRELDVSRQAAAKTLATLEERGYVARGPHGDDARRKRLVVTERGEDLLRQGAEVMDELRDRWAAQISVRRLEALEDRLAELLRQPERAAGRR